MWGRKVWRPCVKGAYSWVKGGRRESLCEGAYLWDTYQKKRGSALCEGAKVSISQLLVQPYRSQAHNANSPNPSRRKWLNDVERNDCSIKFHLSKLSIAKFSILYDISLVRDWKRKLKLITLGSERDTCKGQHYSGVVSMYSQVWIRPQRETVTVSLVIIEF